MTDEEARTARVRNVLWRYLGCAEMTAPYEHRSFQPQPGDHLVLATDGQWKFLEVEALRTACQAFPDPQQCADHLVKLALARGSRDNVTCVVVAFDAVNASVAENANAEQQDAWREVVGQRRLLSYEFLAGTLASW